MNPKYPLNPWHCDKCKKLVDRSSLTELYGNGSLICDDCINEWLYPNEFKKTESQSPAVESATD